MAKISGKSRPRGKPNPQNLTHFKPGQSGNPKGKPKGRRDYATVFWAAIERIAEKKDMTPEEIEEAIQTAGIEKAIKGSFFHYAELNNRIYGKVVDKVDVTSGGKTIADLIATANGRKRRGDTHPTGKDTV